MTCLHWLELSSAFMYLFILTAAFVKGEKKEKYLIMSTFSIHQIKKCSAGDFYRCKCELPEQYLAFLPPVFNPSLAFR